MINKAKPLFLQCLEECHAGSGSSIGLVDLPIQREKNTGFPKFESSTLKGCIREHFEDMQASVDDAINIQHLFGFEQSSNKKAEEKFSRVEDIKKFGEIEKDFAGALSITDARILLFPVRSFYGVWAYLTCPMVLKHFFQQLKTYCEIDYEIDYEIDSLVDQVSSKSVIVDNGITYLEEYKFGFNMDNSIDFLADKLQGLTGVNDIGKRLAIVSDDVFTMFTKHHTVVHTRNKINDKGVADGGALFTEEMLNCETVMYSFVMSNNTFAKQKFEKSDPLAYFTNEMQKHPVFQLGAGFTSGKGILRATIYYNQKKKAMANSLTTLQNIDIKRAEFAFLACKDENNEFAAHVKYFAGLLMGKTGSGLVMALQFAKHKSEKSQKWEKLLEKILEWYSHDFCPINDLIKLKPATINADVDSFMGKFSELRVVEQLMITNETIRLMEWMRRFVKKEDESESKEMSQ